MKPQLFLLSFFCAVLLLGNNIQAQYPVTKSNHLELQLSGNGSGISKYQLREEQNYPGKQNPLSVPGDWDSTLLATDNFDGGGIFATVADGDNLYIGGDFEYFDTVEAYHIIRYNRKTKRLSRLGNGFSGTVRALAIHDGKLYAGGSFSRAGFESSTPLNHLAVWDGIKWSEVGGGVDGTVHTLTSFNGDLYVGGSFDNAGTEPIANLARWNKNQWYEIDPDINSTVYALYSSGDSLYIGGNFWESDRGLKGVALWYNGSIESINGGVDGPVYSVAKKGNDLWVTGDFYRSGDRETELGGIAVYDGQIWKSFGDSQIGLNRSLGLKLYLKGDSVIIGGSFTSVGDVPANSLAVYYKGQWSQLNGGITGKVYSITEFDNQLFVGGYFLTAVGGVHLNIATIPTGSTPAFDEGMGAWGGYNTLTISAIATTEDYVFVAGIFYRIGSVPSNHVAAWNKKTKQWESLDGGADDEVFALTTYKDDLYIGGMFNHVGKSVKARHIAKWNIKTKSWSALGEGSVRNIDAIAADETGIYAAVFFPLKGLSFWNRLGRWNGSAWEELEGDFYGYVNALYKKGTEIYVGGSIFLPGSDDYVNIALHDGSTLYPVGIGMNGRVNTIVGNGSDLYAGGSFTKADGNDVMGVARWDGTTWNALGSGLDDYVITLAADSQGNLYVGGWMNKAGGKSAKYIAKWNGVAWDNFGKGAENGVYALATDETGLYVGGGFTGIGNTNAYRFAKFNFFLNSVNNTQAEQYQLAQNYPNPFNPSTQIRYTLDERSYVKLVVSEPLGREVSTLADGWMNAGDQEVTFNALDLPSGCYTYALTVNGNTISRKMLLSK